MPRPKIKRTAADSAFSQAQEQAIAASQLSQRNILNVSEAESLKNYYVLHHYKPNGRLKNKIVIIPELHSYLMQCIFFHMILEEAYIIGICDNLNSLNLHFQKSIESFKNQYEILQGDLFNSKFCKILANNIVADHDKVDCLINSIPLKSRYLQNTEIPEFLIKGIRQKQSNYFNLFERIYSYIPSTGSVINIASLLKFSDKQSDYIESCVTNFEVIELTRLIACSCYERFIRINSIEFKANTTFSSKTAKKYELDIRNIAPFFVFLASQESLPLTGQHFCLYYNNKTQVAKAQKNQAQSWHEADKKVDEASEESFPASDAPAWITTKS